jgi:RNA polymerase sigma factor (sigma-70 family)
MAMATQALADVLRCIRHLGSDKEGSDGQLLQQFVAGRKDSAFAAIMHRHARLVLAICLQVVGNPHDAEDAFQATFLVLAREAGSIRKRDSLAAWLHRVALNMARKVRSGTAQRRSHERQAVVMSSAGPKFQASAVAHVALRDWQLLIHEEVDRLPEKYRVPVVLCYFEEKTHGEAARQLGWPVGTVKGRLARARDMLRARLERRGLALSTAGLATALTQGLAQVAQAHVPAALFGHTLKAALSFAAGRAIPAGVASAHALVLAKRALQTMTASKLAYVIAMILGPVLLVTYSLVAGTPPESESARLDAPKQAAIRPEAGAEPGDSLPVGALARMGTPRFRHGGPVLSMAYLAGGKILATGGYIGTRRETRMGRIRLWDTVTGKELRQFHLKGTAHVAGSPDGKILAGAEESDGMVYLWEAATGKKIRQFKASRSGFDGILPVAFSGDGKKLVAGGHELRIWEVETGKLLHSVKNQQESVGNVAFSADGKILAAIYIDLMPPQRFHVDPWKELAPLQPKRDIELLAFSPENKTLAVTTRPMSFPLTPELLRASGSIFLHDATSGKLLREIQAHQFVDRRGHERITALTFSPDGKTLASAAADRTIRLWEVATGRERQAFPADSFAIGSLAFAPDGKSLAWANSAGLIRIWDLRTRKTAHGHVGHQGVVTSVALSGDGKTLITASADATIRFWETASGKELRRFEGHQGPIASIHLSRDGKKLASVSPSDKTVRVWELSTGKDIQRFRASTTYCDAAWLPDSRTLAIRRYDDPAVYFCDVTTGKETPRIEKTWTNIGMNYPANIEGAHRGGVLEVSPDGKMLVTGIGFSSGAFRLWDTATGKELPGLASDHNNRIIVKCAVFSPDSKTLLKTESQYSSAIEVWDIATRTQRQQFAGSFKVKDPDGEELEVPTYRTINYLAIAPNGRTLATAGGDPTIRLWDIATGKERRLEGHRGTVTSLAWSSDGKTLVSGSHDGTALVWDVKGLRQNGK